MLWTWPNRGTVPESARRHWGKSPKMSFRLAGIVVGIRTQHLSNVSQYHYRCANPLGPKFMSSTNLSIYRVICLVCLIYLSAYPSVYLFTYLFICLPIRLSIYLSIYLSLCLSISLSAYLSSYSSVYPSIYLSLSVYLSFYLSVSLSLCHLVN